MVTKPEQLEIMVDFMMNHSDLAKDLLNVANAKAKAKNLWDLNVASPPVRDIEKWKKVLYRIINQ